MDLRQEKKVKAYQDVKKTFEIDGPALVAAFPALGPAITEFNTRLDTIWDQIGMMKDITTAITINRQQFRAECHISIMKLVMAMQYQYKITNDKVGFDMVNVSETKVRRLSVGNFFIFCQTVLDHYDPAIYTPLGIIEAEMNALILKLKEYPKAMQKANEARVNRKTAVAEVRNLQREMDEFLRYRVTTLVYQADDTLLKEKLQYYKSLNIGLQGVTTGKAHKEGKPAPDEVVVLDKAKYRSKLAIIVRNDGDTPLLAGRSSNGTEIQGKPFIIEPGKTRKRISLKLGSKGQFILLQNVGDGEGSFKVWLKE